MTEEEFLALALERKKRTAACCLHSLNKVFFLNKCNVSVTDLLQVYHVWVSNK